MDKNILEILLKMFSNQSAQNNTSPTNQSAFSNYPQEAFIQSNNTQNPKNSGADLNVLNSLFSNSGDNNMLPLLLSLMSTGKGGISSIMETLNSKPNDENKGESTPIPDDEILL